MSNIFFIADTHFGHTNIIKYAKRPFVHVTEMNEKFIKLWNEKVKKSDTIYHLGDFALCHPNLARQFASRLNGKKYLIKGNHDKKSTLKAIGEYFEWIKDYHELVIDKQMIVLCHYPFESWNKKSYGGYNLHGHVHSNFDSKNKNILRHDVGVDGNGHAPVSLDQISSIMDKKNWPGSKNGKRKISKNMPNLWQNKKLY